MRSNVLRMFALLTLSLMCSCFRQTGPTAVDGTKVFFDLTGVSSDPDSFWNHPYPSDLRRRADGRPDLDAFPVPAGNSQVGGLVATAMQRPGFPTVAAAYFRFDGPLRARSGAERIPADPKEDVLLVDVSEGAQKGTLYPTVARTLEEDDFLPAHMLAVAPQPGVVLPAGRTYAYVVRRTLGDEQGRLLGIPLAFAQLSAGSEPSVDRGAAAREVFAPLWPVLAQLRVNVADVAAATVFTTGDVVTALAALGDSLRQRHATDILDLHVDPDDGDHPRYCELRGLIRYPVFQQGRPPFSSEGLFRTGADGLPEQTGSIDAPVTVTLPKGGMPSTGFPLMLYIHGSGGLSTEVSDRGTTPSPGGEPTKGEGPAHVVAPFGIAAASAAMPLNPERLPGASDFVYLNLNNLPAFRDTFRSGAVEQRLFLDALLRLRIPAAIASGCSGISLLQGEDAYRFDPDRVVVMGHSMGAMYANIVTATDPRIKLLVASGAGGYWSYFMQHTPRFGPTEQAILGGLVGVSPPLDYLHPVIQLAQTAWEWIDPLVYTARVARRPLDGHPVRPVFQPAGEGDSYFDPPVLDAMAVGYHNQQAGEAVWSSMQQELGLNDDAGIASYPVTQNRRSETGVAYTGVVNQWRSDGNVNSHSVAFQLDGLKYQYGCFVDSFLRSGIATVAAPQPLGTPCP